MHERTWWKQLHWPEYGAELLGTAFLLFAGLSAVVFDFGAGSELSHLLPAKSLRLLITGLLFAGSGSLVAVSPLGKLSGGHINPARSFGPALVSGFWQAQWLYYVASPLGALLAVGAFRLLSVGERDVLTCKLFHIAHYRSVFKDVSAPHLPAHGPIKKTT